MYQSIIMICVSAKGTNSFGNKIILNDKLCIHSNIYAELNYL